MNAFTPSDEQRLMNSVAELAAWLADTAAVPDSPVVRGCLRSADLRGATLADKNLFGADLSYALLDDADLRRADLRHANLFGASLERTNLCGARFDTDTVWPSGFDPRPRGARCMPRSTVREQLN